ncbi:MAG: peptidoglycan-binding protein [Actinomycetota bacterium]
MTVGRWIAAAAAVAVLGVVVWSATAGGEETSGNVEAVRTAAEVERRDLVERETFDGTLGYADARTVSSSLSGTLTSLRSEGAVVDRGEALYRVDGTSVRLLFGRIPAWRTFAAGMEDGRDVRQLERNLVALGHDADGDLEVDDEFDWATGAAVEAWEEDLGLDEDGQIPIGEVVFLPGAVRVGQHHAAAGASSGPGTQVMDVTSTEQVVTVELEADRQELVRRGERVRVTLPGGRSVGGRISEVGRVAEVDPEEEDAEPHIDVTISVRSGPRLDQAPVEVDIEVDRAGGVLAVPVPALLALAEGGYAVEVIEGSGRGRLVAVETGTYADGWVEVEGPGLEAGMSVAVPE